MHLQPLAHGAGLVLADVAEPVAVQPFRKVQVRSVLNHQDSLTAFHATNRPFAVPAQDTFRIDLFPFTADEPIVGFQFVPISREALRVRSRRMLRLGSGDAYQPLLEVLMTKSPHFRTPLPPSSRCEKPLPDSR